MRRNKWITGTAVAVLGMALAALAQSGSTPIDTLKVRQEMETMKGILQTTIRFATQSTDDSEIAFHGVGEDIQGYFLLGQGALFIIPVGSLESRSNLDAVLALEMSVRDAENQRVISERYLRDIERQVREAMRSAEAAERGALRAFDLRWDAELAPEPPEPPDSDDLPESPDAPALATPPLPPGAPVPSPAPSAGRGASGARARAQAVDAQKRLQALQQRLTEKKVDTEKKLKELEADLAHLREGLVDALAKHGDSLSILRPEDSITLILTREGGSDFAFGPVFRMRVGSKSEETGTTVLSVRKSAISDLKAGRISHDQFLQKVVQYQQ